MILKYQRRNISFAKEFCNRHNISKDRTVAFCVVSEREGARVPENIYIKVANYLIKQGKNIYFVYGPNEREQVINVYKKIEDKSKCIIDYKMTTIIENRAILERCNFYLGNDGGTKHISITAKIPTFALFYKDNFIYWTPPNNEKHLGIQFLDNDKSLSTKEIISKLGVFMNTNNLTI